MTYSVCLSCGLCALLFEESIAKLVDDIIYNISNYVIYSTYHILLSYYVIYRASRRVFQAIVFK